MTLDDLKSLLSRLQDDPTQVTDDDLAAARAAVQEQVDAVRGQAATGETVALLTSLRDVRAAVTGEQESRATAAAEVNAEAERLLGELDTPDPEPQDDDQGGDGGGQDDDGGTGETAETPELVSVAASLARVTEILAQFATTNTPPARPAAQPQGRTARRIGGTTTIPRPAAEAITAEVFAGTSAEGARVTDPVDLARMYHDRLRGPYRTGSFKGRMPIAHAKLTYPESRTLGTDVVSNHRLINAATEPTALTAAGGLCAPLQTYYDIEVVGSSARPVKDQALTGFQVPRGGLTFRPHMSAASAVHGAGTWTMAQDEAGTDTKACYEVDCPGMEEEYIQAVYLCLRFSNITSMFDPETHAANLRQGEIAHARLAENELLAKMNAKAKLLTSTRVIGATRDLLVTLDKVTAYKRNRHRIEDSMPLIWLAPGWVKSMIRADLARQMAAGDWMEALAPADSLIDGWFQRRGVTPVWHLDGPVGTDEVQTITITGTPTGGTYTLTYSGQTTAPIAYNATAAAVKDALAALSNIHAEDITTAGGAHPGTPITVTFGSGEFDGQNVAQMTASSAGLTGGSSPTVTVTTTTGGGGAITVQGVSIASQVYGEAAAAGTVPGFPGQIDSLLYDPGAYLFLDGGELDLGLVRDSTLNSKNDHQEFRETFEGVAHRGIEPLRVVMNLEPTGQTAGTKDLDSIND